MNKQFENRIVWMNMKKKNHEWINRITYSYLLARVMLNQCVRILVWFEFSEWLKTWMNDL